MPLSQLGIDDLKRPNDAFEVGEELTMKVTRVDVPNHRLILSVKALARASRTTSRSRSGRRSATRCARASRPTRRPRKRR